MMLLYKAAALEEDALLAVVSAALHDLSCCTYMLFDVRLDHDCLL